MAGLRVFVSSTCYDLSVIRAQLRIFIQNLGHEPLMSDYSDLLYDPRIHTHTSCVDEVASADVVVLIVGARFGGKTVPEALAKLDFDLLKKESKSTESLTKKENLSVTQLEILKAVESGIPVFTFVDQSVWHDHALYEKNKDKPIINDISFPSIEKPETASFIFEFINFLRHRARGNSVFTFSKLQDIEDALKRQWSSLFQKLIQEQRNRAFEAKRLDNLTEQFEDLKTAILTSIGTTNERDVARGVVRFRRLIDFVRALGLKDHSFLIRGHHTWDELLYYAEIEKVLDASDLPEEFSYQRRSFGPRARMYLIKRDGTFFELRTSPDFFHNLSLEWGAFMELSEETREIIVDALSEMRPGMGPLRYVREPFNYYFDKWVHQERLLKDIDDSENGQENS
ncbi:DUF4062 domain-containing protein [Shewanella xiamenensis]|uniref:DUF4062 domain-containing protein n=1 Tax=Shewanella xiamenensis TaxID=332186 RepID=A0AAE4TQ72_9GAMM|nr:DUF4062 domain-containing protein [Shewanella xiamenensis]MDH1626356.1 DUF4062 domain-containing protein [Shewanella xiamenensis]MDV5392588.1 DUF4062 domain-containing protein [Shewanella xiamenensis]UML93562.1 DUF4062 domain-containing protein [Shewanella xiamenensis]BDQ68041.1 hypothetical protein NUITMVS2_38530 [Shewanella xiamenensis]GLD78381.1 hypothetical protein NUITMVS3_28130 [Shewanella xiamenensis]